MMPVINAKPLKKSRKLARPKQVEVRPVIGIAFKIKRYIKSFLKQVLEWILSRRDSVFELRMFFSIK